MKSGLMKSGAWLSMSEVASAVERLITESEARDALQRGLRAMCTAMRGATDRTLSLIKGVSPELFARK